MTSELEQKPKPLPPGYYTGTLEITEDGKVYVRLLNGSLIFVGRQST